MALYRHVLQGTYPGEVWTFRLHTEGNISLAAAQSAWDGAVTAFASTDYLATLCTSVEFTEVSTAELDLTTGKQLQKVANTRDDVGTNASGCLPFQCTPVVSLRTAFATRSGRGRFYAPSPAVDQQDGGRLTTAAQTTLADSAQALLTTLINQNAAPVLVSFPSVVRTTITGMDVGDVIDTQRRRRNKLIESRMSRAL